MIRVSSGSVTQLTDERHEELIAEINAAQDRIALTLPLVTLALASSLYAVWALGSEWRLPMLVAGVLVTAAAFMVGRSLDAGRKNAVVMYDLDEHASRTFEEMTIAFDGLNQASAKWHIDSGGTIYDPHTAKRNAGAGRLLDRRRTEFGYGLPEMVKSNVTVPFIKSGKETLYFFPDTLLVVEAARVGAVDYDNLIIRCQVSQFIENDPVPPDAEVIGYSWAFPNKDGGPDRRFANNRQIPVCLYESMHFTSLGGLNELVQVSVVGQAERFVRAIRSLATLDEGDGSERAQPPQQMITSGGCQL